MPEQARKRVDGRAQRGLHVLGVEVLLEHVELAAHPGLADQAVERRERLDDEALQALAHQPLRERELERARIV